MSNKQYILKLILNGDIIIKCVENSMLFMHYMCKNVNGKRGIVYDKF